MTDTGEASGFWGFSLKSYAKDGVPAACLEAQDTYGADVNVLLYLLWRGSSGEVLDRQSVADLEAAAMPFRETVVQPLREIRRALKDSPFLSDADAQESLRGKIKKIELEAERREQEHLERLSPEPADRDTPGRAAEKNLSLYNPHLMSALPDVLVSTLVSAIIATH